MSYQHNSFNKLLLLVPFMAPVTTRAASYWTVPKILASPTTSTNYIHPIWHQHILSIWSNITLIKTIKFIVKLSLYFKVFNTFNALLTFAYVLRIWIFHENMEESVNPKCVCDSTPLSFLHLNIIPDELICLFNRGFINWIFNLLL